MDSWNTQLKRDVLQELCEKKNAALVKIDNEEENDWLKSRNYRGNKTVGASASCGT